MSTSLTSIFPQMGTRGSGREQWQAQLQRLPRPRRTPTASRQLLQRPADTQQPGSPSSSNSRSNTTLPLWARTHPRPRSRARPEVTSQRPSRRVPMSRTRPSAFLTTALPSPLWPPGLSLQSMRTTRPQGRTTPTPARPQGCTQPSLTWAPPRGPCTLPSLTQPVCRSHTAPRTGNSLSTQRCHGHDRQRDHKVLVQVRPPCQTQGAAGAAAATVLVASEVKVVWARGIGQAPVEEEEAGEAGWEKPCSALAQEQRCCHSPRMSLKCGAFEAWLIIWATQCSSQRVCQPPPHKSGSDLSQHFIQHRQQRSEVEKDHIPIGLVPPGEPHCSRHPTGEQRGSAVTGTMTHSEH